MIWAGSFRAYLIRVKLTAPSDLPVNRGLTVSANMGFSFAANCVDVDEEGGEIFKGQRIHPSCLNHIHIQNPTRPQARAQATPPVV